MRDNFGRFQKHATINLTKKLQKIADQTQINVQETIAEELEKKYKDNVLASYSPRGDGSYIHTNTFLDSIHVVIEEDRGIGRSRVKVVLDEDKKYPQTYVYDKSSKKWVECEPRTVGQVYEYLTKGTMGGGVYGYKEQRVSRFKNCA